MNGDRTVEQKVYEGPKREIYIRASHEYYILFAYVFLGIAFWAKQQ